MHDGAVFPPISDEEMGGRIVISAKLGGVLDWQALRPQFVRNLPGNYESAAAVAKELDGIVSRKTIHELLPFIANADTEAARMAAERKEA